MGVIGTQYRRSVQPRNRGAAWTLTPTLLTRHACLGTAPEQVYRRRVDAEDRGKVLELIEAMINADGVVTAEERQFVRRLAERLGLSDDDHGDRPAPSDPGRAMRMLRELSPDLQAKVMALLVEAAVVDGKVAPEEHALLLASAATLGIEACALEERIARRLKSSMPDA
jgi:uncharacterized tellurite resistance protein B-like protein